MKLTELLTIATSAERIPYDAAKELMEYGITAFLAEGVPYATAVDIISRAEISCSREKTQSISFPA
tara:strand:- start:60 stop:257 length:198 start_codon:yes stop_codon:yes gene_type:complete